VTARKTARREQEKTDDEFYHDPLRQLSLPDHLPLLRRVRLSLHEVVLARAAGSG
jgi:hypothetical protein